MYTLQTPRLCVVGGDAREWHAACSLKRAGFDVVYVGPLPPRGAEHPGGPVMRRSVGDALPGCDAVVGPVRGFGHADAQAVAGALEQRELVLRVVVAGNLPRFLAAACAQRGVAAVDLLDRDEFAVANAVPTAEGAIVEALQAADVTLAGSRALVLGFGRTGRVLAPRLHALGADVRVFARSPEDRALARAWGFRTAPFESLAAELPGADFVFNTVPARVLDESVLRRCRRESVIVDIASPPGGVDFDAAAALGLVTRWPLGIPGRFAPRTAGWILAEAAELILAEHGIRPRFALPVLAGGD